MSRTSGGSESRRTHGSRRRCWRRCPIWRHRPPHWPREGPANGTARPGLGGGQAVPAPLGDEEAPRGATDVWGDLEEAFKRGDPQGRRPAIQALERRTHPLTCEQDHIDPVIYTGLEIRAQVNRGERPAPEQVVGIFWAKGDGVFWTRQTRTWDLPSLTGVNAHRFTFKYIYSAWTTFPLIVKTQRRGCKVDGGNILQMRKEAVPFLESLGIPKPRSIAEWSYIFKEMGTFLAAKKFIVNCPLPVMEIPVAPVHDSKEALRFRAVCDTKLVSGLSKSSMVEVKVNWRCNVVHDWVE